MAIAPSVKKIAEVIEPIKGFVNQKHLERIAKTHASTGAAQRITISLLKNEKYRVERYM